MSELPITIEILPTKSYKICRSDGLFIAHVAVITGWVFYQEATYYLGSPGIFPRRAIRYVCDILQFLSQMSIKIVLKWNKYTVTIWPIL